MPQAEERLQGLNAIIGQRSEKILKRFGQVAIENVSNPRLIEALEDVKKYWKDFSRPALTSFSCEAVGGNPEKAEGVSLMFTLASSGFGVHDDILDKSLTKHFRKTLLGLHGLDTALLVGDLLMVKAWTVMHEMIEIDSHLAAEIFNEYGRFCVEVCEAEFEETLCRKNIDTDLNFYQGILLKAMGETAVCCRIGAMLGGGGIVEVEALSEFGRSVGFMSRLADDLEDCLNVKADLVHRIYYESVPLPLLYAAQSSQDRYSEIKSILEKEKIDPSDVKLLLEVCFESGAFEYVKKIAEETAKLAKGRLDLIKNSNARDVLLLVIEKSYERIRKLCV